VNKLQIFTFFVALLTPFALQFCGNGTQIQELQLCDYEVNEQQMSLYNQMLQVKTNIFFLFLALVPHFLFLFDFVFSQKLVGVSVRFRSGSVDLDSHIQCVYVCLGKFLLLVNI